MQKGKNSILTLEGKKSHGKAKGFLPLNKSHVAKVRTPFLLLKIKSYSKKKGNSPILTLKKISHSTEKSKNSIHTFEKKITR